MKQLVTGVLFLLVWSHGAISSTDRYYLGRSICENIEAYNILDNGSRGYAATDVSWSFFTIRNDYVLQEYPAEEYSPTISDQHGGWRRGHVEGFGRVMDVFEPHRAKRKWLQWDGIFAEKRHDYYKSFNLHTFRLVGADGVWARFYVFECIPI